MELAQQPDIYSVGFSQKEAGVALTRYLLERGRRRIAFAAAQLDPRTLQRKAGWRQALEAADLYDPALEWQTPEPSSIALGGRMFGQVIGAGLGHGPVPGVDAIFFCNDDLAQGALLAALRLGVAVPEQVAITGFNDLTGSDQMLPPLTTIRTPRSEVGAAAARMLLALMAGQPVAQPCVDLGYELVARGSA
jgi:LacI family gluconate utilization system Gnt-I transcriptional repressor